MKQARLIISGSVQGIGYRYFVKSNAERFGLTGWVRNTSDRSVEAVFQPSTSSGQEAKGKIEQMIALCKKGPFLAEVKDVVVTWEESENQFSDFSVLDK